MLPFVSDRMTCRAAAERVLPCNNVVLNEMGGVTARKERRETVMGLVGEA